MSNTIELVSCLQYPENTPAIHREDVFYLMLPAVLPCLHPFTSDLRITMPFKNGDMTMTDPSTLIAPKRAAFPMGELYLSSIARSRIRGIISKDNGSFMSPRRQTLVLKIHRGVRPTIYQSLRT